MFLNICMAASPVLSVSSDQWVYSKECMHRIIALFEGSCLKLSIESSLCVDSQNLHFLSPCTLADIFQWRNENCEWKWIKASFLQRHASVPWYFWTHQAFLESAASQMKTSLCQIPWREMSLPIDLLNLCSQKKMLTSCQFICWKHWTGWQSLRAEENTHNKPCHKASCNIIIFHFFAVLKLLNVIPCCTRLNGNMPNAGVKKTSMTC